MEKNKLSREEIKRLAKESAGALSWIALLEPLVIDTNILADHAWARDNNITYLIEEIVPDHPEFLIVVPHICKVEFKLITREEVNTWNTLI